MALLISMLFGVVLTREFLAGLIVGGVLGAVCAVGLGILLFKLVDQMLGDEDCAVGETSF